MLRKYLNFPRHLTTTTRKLRLSQHAVPLVLLVRKGPSTRPRWLSKATRGVRRKQNAYSACSTKKRAEGFPMAFTHEEACVLIILGRVSATFESLISFRGILRNGCHSREQLLFGRSDRAVTHLHYFVQRFYTSIAVNINLTPFPCGYPAAFRHLFHLLPSLCAKSNQIKYANPERHRNAVKTMSMNDMTEPCKRPR